MYIFLTLCQNFFEFIIIFKRNLFKTFYLKLIIYFYKLWFIFWIYSIEQFFIMYFRNSERQGTLIFLYFLFDLQNLNNLLSCIIKSSLRIFISKQHVLFSRTGISIGNKITSKSLSKQIYQFFCLGILKIGKGFVIVRYFNFSIIYFRNKSNFLLDHTLKLVGRVLLLRVCGYFIIIYIE